MFVQFFCCYTTKPLDKIDKKYYNIYIDYVILCRKRRESISPFSYTFSALIIGVYQVYSSFPFCVRA